MSRWLDPKLVPVPSALGSTIGGHPLVAETLVRRGVTTPAAARAFLDPSAYRPSEPGALPDLDRAIERLHRAVQRREPIVVWGDFDADGQTATALLLEALSAWGAAVTHYIPTREEGHGLHKHSLERLISSGRSESPDPAATGPFRLVLTCDTGVTGHAAVARANDLGAEVIITDHHVPGDRLPPALAVVNPHRLPPEHPMAALTGVGVAFQLARALDAQLAERALDLVALGTVADVGTLTGDNRYWVQRGLEALRQTKRPGLQAVYQRADLRPEGMTEEHIGFVLGPRLNALGRLADADHGVELLTTADPTRAQTLATEVEGLNARRQWLTRQVTDAALRQIQQEPSLLSDHQALVLSHSTWPGGIIGIVAGRLAERFGKPTVLISAPEGQLAHGSARSVPGVNLIEALVLCAEAPSGSPLLERYGGHRAAAGFSLEAERIPELRAALSRAIAAQVETLPERVLVIDAYVDLPELTLDLVADIGRLAPFGPGNPPLTLAVRDLCLLSDAIIGRTGEHRRITVEDTEGCTQTVFWWQGADWPLPRGRFDLALTARASDYRGLAEVQVEWIDSRECEPEVVQVQPAPAIEVRDYRAVSHPVSILSNLARSGDWQIWAEGENPPGLEARTRQTLEVGPRLVLWTLPPGPQELRAVLDRVEPAEVALFAHDPGLDRPDVFLQQLVGLVKFALRTRRGELELEAAAARLGHRVGTVAAGLELLAAQGAIQVTDHGDSVWHLAQGTVQPGPDAPGEVRTRLQDLLAETAAFRDYARSAPAPALLRR